MSLVGARVERHHLSHIPLCSSFYRSSVHGFLIAKLSLTGIGRNIALEGCRDTGLEGRMKNGFEACILRARVAIILQSKCSQCDSYE